MLAPYGLPLPAGPSRKILVQVKVGRRPYVSCVKVPWVEAAEGIKPTNYGQPAEESPEYLGLTNLEYTPQC